MSYISLSDLYETVVMPASPVTLPPSKQVASTHIAPVVPFNPGVTSPVTRWDQTGSDLFNYVRLDSNGKPTVGRGEYSVAYLLTGLKTVEEINAFKNKDGSSIIGKTSKSVDVTLPTGKYEVKEIPFGDSVKTGALNDPVLTGIRKAVENVLEPIEAAYDALDEQGQQQVNQHLIDVFTGWYKKTYQPKAKRPAPDTVAKWNNQLTEFYQTYKNWTLKKYIRNILEHLRELPKGLLLGDEISLGRYGKRTAGEGEPVIIFSIPQLERFLFQQYGITPATYTPAVNDLTDILYKYYGETEADKEFLKRQAQQLDIQLGQERAKEFGKRSGLDFFRRAVAHINLPRRVALIKDAFGASGLQKIFPHTGIFIVTPQDYQYVPRAELQKYIEIASVSGGEVKISRKSNATV